MKRLAFCTAVLLEILCAAELDIFVSGLPKIQQMFGISTSHVELMLVINLVAGGAMAFIIGAWGDKYGTRSVIVGGLVVFAMGSCLCAFSQSYNYVLLGRLIQGVGIAGPGVLSYVIIAEVYHIDEQPRLMALMSGWITFAMAFIPIIGSYVNSHYGWRYNFIILFAYAVIAICVTIYSLPNSSSAPHVNASSYLPLFKSKKAWCFMLAVCFLSGVYWVYIGIAPIYYAEVFKVSVKSFGYHQAFITFTFGVLCLCNGFLIKYYSVRKCFIISMVSATFCTIVIAFFGIFEPNHVFWITGVCALAVASLMFPINVLYPIALGIVPGTKARTAALIRSFRLLLSGVMLQITSELYSGSFSFISISLVLLLVIGLSLAWISWRKVD